MGPFWDSGLDPIVVNDHISLGQRMALGPRQATRPTMKLCCSGRFAFWKTVLTPAMLSGYQKEICRFNAEALSLGLA